MSRQLVQLLRARLDEAERLARAATEGPWRCDPNKYWREPGGAWREEAVFAGPPGERAVCVAGTGDVDDPQSMADAEHIAHHDPSAVLADIAAKRAILDLYEARLDACCQGRAEGYQPGSLLGETVALADVVRLLVTVGPAAGLTNRVEVG